MSSSYVSLSYLAQDGIWRGALMCTELLYQAKSISALIRESTDAGFLVSIRPLP